VNLSKSLRILPPLLLLALVSAVFWPGLGGGFIFDDHSNVQTNPRIQIEQLDLESIGKAARAYEPGAYGRPVATISLALDYYVHGKEPWGYKLTNLLIHLLNTVLAWLLARSLLSLPRTNPPWGTWTPIAIATAWAAHPLQVSTVLYIVQRMELLAATFLFLAILAYLHGRLKQVNGQRGGLVWLAVSAALAMIGMLSKESAVLFPGFTLALELTLLRFEASSRRVSSLLKWAYVATVILALVTFFGYIVPTYASLDSFTNRDFNAYERVLTQMRVLPLYIGQSLLPLPSSLLFYYDTFPKSTGWLSPWTTTAGAAFLLVLAGFAWRGIRRFPLVSFGIMWFFVAHALTSGPLNLEQVFEHRNYFSLFGIILAVADGIRRIPMRDGPALKDFAVVAVLAMSCFLTLIRAATWGNQLLLASDLVAKNPNSARASNDLAMIYVDMAGASPDSPFFYMAMTEFERGSKLPGSSPLPEQGLLLLSAVSGYPAEDRWWDSLLHKIRTQPIGPEQMMAVSGLMAQHRKGFRVNPQRLATAYQVLLDRGNWPAYVYADFADFIHEEIKDPDWASHLYVKAVSQDPQNVEFASLLVGTLIAENKTEYLVAVLDKLEEFGISIPSMSGGEGLPDDSVRK
jgi:hypothetical protein